MTQVFESFFQELKTDMNVEDTDKKTFSDLLNKYYAPIAAQIVPQIIETKGGKKTGYAIFLGLKNTELKQANPNWAIRQKMITDAWGLLTPTEKTEWNNKAATTKGITVPITVVSKPKKGLNGWNLFVQETKLADKSATFTSTAALWKVLSLETKETYKARAKNPHPLAIMVVITTPKKAF